jgi:Domain of unknown function (DUF4190)
MTDVVTRACESCGAEVHGTRFCESCGVPVAAVPNFQAPMLPVAGPVFSGPVPVGLDARGGTPLRVLTLLCLLVAIFIPTLFTMSSSLDPGGQAETVVQTSLDVLTGLFALLSAFVGKAGSGAKVGGVLLALVYVAGAVVMDVPALSIAGVLNYSLLWNGALLALYLSWAVSRPFRGPGYFGILILIGLALLSQPIDNAIYSSSAYAIANLLYALIAAVFTLATVGFSVLFERRSSLARSVQPFGVGQAIGTANSKANASLALSLSGLALNILSRVVPYGLGTAISVVGLVLLILAIVVGHIARREIRNTGQLGSGRALAGLLIGYIDLGLGVAVLLYVAYIALAFTASFS